jgi:nucleotide-binding universal stress UspA family protein
MRIQQILCPTDLSNNSKTGILYARAFSQQHGARLIVLHVTSIPRPPIAAYAEIDTHPFDRPIYVPPSVDQLLSRAAARLEEFIRTIAIEGCQVRVALGDPAREIVLSAFCEKADLIVMAKRHLCFTRRLVSRSISEQVSRKAPCPVMSICPLKLQRPITAQQSRPATVLADLET